MQYKDEFKEKIFDDYISDEENSEYTPYELSDLDKFLTDELLGIDNADGSFLADDTNNKDKTSAAKPAKSDKTKSQKKTGVQINSIHKGHRTRVHEKFMKHGFEVFSDYEVLEFLLFYAIPYKDTNVIAHNLIDKFGSVKAVMEADHYDLLTVDGIGDRAASLIVMLRELYKYISTSHYTKDVLYTSDVSGEYCVNYFRNHVEESFILISLDTDKKVKCIDIISKGTETETAFYIRNIIKAIIKNRVANVILAHNHPGNNAEPSSDDMLITEKIGLLLRGLGVTVVDHIICSGNKFISFSEKGYLKS